MPSNITEVVLQLRDEMTARLVKLESQVGKTGKQIETSFSKTFKESATNVRAFFQNVQSGFNLFKNFAVNAGRNAEQIQNLSKQFGISTDEMQRFLFVGNRTGLGAEEVGSMIARLTKKMKEQGLESLDVSDVLKRIGADFRGMKDGAEKAAKAQAILGRSGANAIPFLEGFADAWEKATNSLLTPEELEQLGKFDDAIDDLSKSFDKLKGSAAPALGTIADGINNILAKKGSSDSFFGSPRMDLITSLGLSLVGSGMGDEGIEAARLREQMEEDARILGRAQKAFASDRAAGGRGFSTDAQGKDPLDGVTDKLSKADEEAQKLNKKLGKTNQLLIFAGAEPGSFLAKMNAQFAELVDSAKQFKGDIEAYPNRIKEAAEAAEDLAKSQAEITAKFIEDQQKVREENEAAAADRAERLRQSEEARQKFAFARTPAGAIEGFSSQMDLITNDLTDLQQRGAMIANDIAGAFGSSFENLFLDVAEQGFSNLEDSARRFGATVLQQLAQIAARQAAMSLVGGIGTALGFGGVTAQAMGGVLPGSVTGTIPFRAFAGGGVVSEPTLALMGEGRSPAEAFVPLPDGKSIPVKMAGDRGEAKNVNVSFVLPTLDPKSFGEFLVENKKTIKNLIAEAINTDSSFRRHINSAR